MIIDAMEFARAGQVLEGTAVASTFVRLCEGLPQPQDAQVSWRLAGRCDAGTGQLWLDVQAQGRVRVVCQRCIEPFGLDLQVDNTLGLVRNTAELEAMEALETAADDAGPEYLVAERHLDVLALIEDELILVLPYAPRHAVCPEPSDEPSPSRQSKPSPFAVLEQLRKH
ncbi:YceD family protein [Castellaniella caeni]|uniref:YceD family protein n=1 Tax=Castellaniella caeni TaxID=266123 RepID=UPI00082CC40A|nr:YceD family protein [Castellaniella caeni]